MTVEIKSHTIIKIHSTYNSIDELREIERIYFSVLLNILLNKPALIITIAPVKSYSIGYELGDNRELKIGKSTFLINEIKSCSESILQDLCQSEEFTRGLLILMKYDIIQTENLEMILPYIQNNLGLENLPYETIVCENDGRTLCIYNTTLTKDALSQLI